MWFQYFILGLSVYTLMNGLLHDIFVLKKHKGEYDRNLLRLLMDGHILLTGGMIYLAAYFLTRQNNNSGLYLCLIASISLIIYCIMIFPFLKSIGTLSLNIAMLLATLIKFF